MALVSSVAGSMFMPAPGCTTLTMHQPDDQRDRADDLEIQQRQPAGLADLLHVFHAGDADHHRAEDDRRDDHLDQLDEAIAERLHARAHRGVKVAQGDAGNHGTHHLKVQ